MQNKKIRLLFFSLIILFSSLHGKPAYYFAPGSCPKCESFFSKLKRLENIDPSFLVYGFDPYSNSGRNEYLKQWRSLEFINEDDYFAFPALFVGDTVLVGLDFDDSLILQCFHNIENQDIIDEEKNYNSFYILFLGLLDGVNPCAFTALIFLLSFLTLKKKKRKYIFLSAILYISGVFVFYLIFGYGMLRLIKDHLGIVPSFSIVVKLLLSLFCFIAAFLQFSSVLKKETKHTSLSSGNVKGIHKIIRLTSNKLFFLSFFVGFAVGFSELLCTGQIYLPTLIVISSFDFKAVFNLVLYNIFFILPLVIIVTVFWFLPKISVFRQLYDKYWKTLKIIMGIVMIALGIYLIFITINVL